jgi:hypothetical protein
MTRRKNKIWKILKPVVMVGILVWWGAMLFLLIQRHKKPEPVSIPDINLVESGEVLSESYYSITYRGEKIGFSSNIKRRALSGGFMFQGSSFYRLPVAGVQHEVISQSILNVDDSLRTRVLSFDFSGDNYSTTVNAVVEGLKLRITHVSENSSHTEEFELSQPIYSMAVLPELLLRRGFRRGEFELATFDPMTSSERNYTVSVIGEDRLDRFGSKTVHVVKLGYGQLSSKLYFDDDGLLLMENTPEGFMSVLEDKKTALAMDIRDGGTRDLLEDFALPLGMGVIHRPREAVELVITIENLSAGIFNLDDFNQKWNSEDRTLHIMSSGFESVSDEYPTQSTDTAETPAIQCNDRRIINAATKITKGATNDLEKLSKINDYLFKNIKKDHTLSIPSALDVLQRMRGDCNEHTILFVALARSLHIPARMNVGLVYLDGYFYYHAWPQAFAEGTWHTFDPTFGQFPADATHIKLTSGSLDEYLALLRMGDARMKLISVKYANGEVFMPGNTNGQSKGQDGTE